MTDKIFFPQPVTPVKPKPVPSKTPGKVPPQTAFNEVLKAQQETIKFSKHAQKRLEERSISLSAQDIQRISTALDKAGQKGAKDSLILMENLALVVSVKNKTVITAVDGDSLKENVFTKIDSAVII